MLCILYKWCDIAWLWVKAGWPKEYSPPLITLSIFLFSLWTYWRVKERERFKLGIDLILKLGERFNADAMATCRAKAADALLLGAPAQASHEVGAVFDFFEEVGYLLHRRAISLDAVDAFFSFWIEPYFRASTSYRADRVSDGVWSEFNKMALQLRQFRHRNNFWWWTRWAHPLVWHVYYKHKADNSWAGMTDSVKLDLGEERKLVPAVGRASSTKTESAG